MPTAGLRCGAFLVLTYMNITPTAVAAADAPVEPLPPVAAVAEAGPPGAAACFTSTDPAIVAAVSLYRQGAFAEAERRAADAADRTAAADLVEVIRRARREYGLDAAAIQEKIRPSIPDVTPDDVARWIASKELQHRNIDGQIKIFRREPGHLFRFSADAQRRRDAARAADPATQPATAEAGWTMDGHVRAVIDAAKATGEAYVLPVRTRVTYTLTVAPNAAGAKRGSTLSVWLPFPHEYRQQRDVRLLESEPPAAVIAPPALDGNPVGGVPQRTVFLQRTVDDPSRPQRFRVKFEYVTSAYYPTLNDADARPGDPATLSTYLLERPPHLVFPPELRAKVAEVVGDDPNPLSKARKLFYYLDENLRWTPEEEYCVIPNLNLHGFARGKGDCGVASMLYISMCRIAGVPARWQSGWTPKPVGWNMHDWVEIYVEPWGWLPVDPSHGRRKSDDPAVRDFHFGHTDSYRLIVNLDYGRALHPAKAALRSEPADFQRGEVELDGRNLYFDEWDYDIEFERDSAP